MKVALSDELKADGDLSWLARGTVPLVEQEFSGMAGFSAIWDLKQDPRHRPLLILSVRDLFGSAKALFSPDELKDPAHTYQRLHTLRGELILGKRRSVIGVQDQAVSVDQLERLRQALNSIPNISQAGLKMDNRVSMGGESVLLTNFTIEVDESFLPAVKEAIARSGFIVRETPLASRPSIVNAVKKLAAAHASDAELTPSQIVWFRLEDPKDVHLLEISATAFDSGDGSLQGIALGAGMSVPEARAIVVYVAPPAEVHKAFEVNPNHPAIHALLERQYRVLYPDDSGASLLEEFPEMAGAAV